MSMTFLFMPSLCAAQEETTLALASFASSADAVPAFVLPSTTVSSSVPVVGAGSSELLPQPTRTTTASPVRPIERMDIFRTPELTRS